MQNKAAGVRSFAQTVRTMAGEPAWNRTVEALSPATRAVVLTPPLPMQWVDGSFFLDLLATSHRHAFNGDTRRLIDVGRTQLKNDMNTLYKMMIRMVNLDRLLKKAADIYGTYTDNGRMTGRRISETESLIMLEGVQHGSEALWQYQAGCVAGTVEQAGFKHPQVLLTSSSPTGCVIRVMVDAA